MSGYKLTREQDRFADQLCIQFEWLNEHELKEVSAHFGISNIAYSGNDLCEHIAYHSLLGELTLVLKKYLPRVKVRKNPPLDKIERLIAEAATFKSNCFMSSLEEFDMFCLENYIEVYRKFEESHNGTMHVGYIRKPMGGMGFNEKIKLLVNMVGADILCKKFFSLYSWRKPWLKAIDIVTGNSGVNLWGDSLSSADVDLSTLLAEREDTMKSAAEGSIKRSALQREIEKESMILFANDQKKRAEEVRKQAAFDQRERDAEVKSCNSSSRVANKKPSLHEDECSFRDAYSIDSRYEREKERIFTEKAEFDWEGKCTYDPWGSHLKY